MTELTLELYAPAIKSAVAGAQQLADALSNEVVTVNHVLRKMLEAGIGRDVCARADVDHAALLRTAIEATNKLPRDSKLSHLDAELLATLGRAEIVMSDLGRSAVDGQCMFVALAARKHIPARLGISKWTEADLAAGQPAARPGKSLAVAFVEATSPTASFGDALVDAASAITGLMEEISVTWGQVTTPPEVTVTLRLILSLFTYRFPMLRGEFDAKGSLALWREDVIGKRVVTEWSPPSGIALTIRKGEAPTIFTLNSENRWLSGEQELFVALRAAISGLYMPVGSATNSTFGPSEPVGDPALLMAALMNVQKEPCFICPRCEQVHTYKEPAFNWPDAVFALSLSDDERAAITIGGDNEDVARVRDACFVRGVAFLPVHEWEEEQVGIGFWLRISPDDFHDFERRKRVDHPVYMGDIGNQVTYLGPTLGLRASMSFRGPGLRPALTLLDAAHPLAIAQKAGVSAEVVRQWLSANYHPGDDEPKGPPRTPRLATDGYRIVGAAESGRALPELPRRPAAGDRVKILVEFLGADASGDAKPTIAGWWLKLDDVSGGLVSGTLQNVPRLPAPVVLGTRFWLSPEHIIEFSPGQD